MIDIAEEPAHLQPLAVFACSRPVKTLTKGVSILAVRWIWKEKGSGGKGCKTGDPALRKRRQNEGKWRPEGKERFVDQ